MKGDQEGFTLLELLLAATLTAVVATVLAAAFFAGFRVWQRVGLPQADEAVIVFEMVQATVNNTLPCRLAPFKGGRDWVEIPCLVSGQDGTDVQDQPGTIRYEFNDTARAVEQRVHRYSMPDPETETQELLIENVDRLEFSYAGTDAEGSGIGGWSGEWNTRTNAPCAVKMVMQLSLGGDRIEVERIMVVPCRH